MRKKKSLTKYAVGAKPNPPKNPRRSPKKGKVIPKINVKAVTYQQTLITYKTHPEQNNYSSLTLLIV